jgi:hypothetical protein
MNHYPPISTSQVARITDLSQKGMMWRSWRAILEVCLSQEVRKTRKVRAFFFPLLLYFDTHLSQWLYVSLASDYSTAPAFTGFQKFFSFICYSHQWMKIFSYNSSVVSSCSNISLLVSLPILLPQLVHSKPNWAEFYLLDGSWLMKMAFTIKKTKNKTKQKKSHLILWDQIFLFF